VERFLNRQFLPSNGEVCHRDIFDTYNLESIKRVSKINANAKHFEAELEAQHLDNTRAGAELSQDATVLTATAL